MIRLATAQPAAPPSAKSIFDTAVVVDDLLDDGTVATAERYLRYWQNALALVAAEQQALFDETDQAYAMEAREIEVRTAEVRAEIEARYHEARLEISKRKAQAAERQDEATTQIEVWTGLVETRRAAADGATWPRF